MELVRERGRTERLQGWREMWMKGFRERGQPTKVLLGSLIEASPRAFLWLCSIQATKRVFFIYFFNFMPRRPLSGSRPSPKLSLPVFLAAPQSLLQKKKKTLHRDIVVSVLLFFSCAIRVREPGNLSTNRKLLNLWLCWRILSQGVGTAAI